MAVSTAERKTALAKGQAMKPLPGSAKPRYPIRNRGELEDALKDYNRVAAGKKAGVAAYIRGRAKALGLTSLLPDGFPGG
jgi:hypothetical protein